jgi:cytoskeletal protein CcmA (bactofilin family)
MDKDDKGTSFLGKGTRLEGRLRFQGSMRIDGYFKGEVSAQGNLIVGENALIEGDLKVSYTSVSGEVHGSISAEQRVDLRAPGKVFGSIQSPAVVMEEGVIFEGTSKMYQAKPGAGTTEFIDADDYHGGPPPDLTAIYGMVTDQNTGQPIKSARVTCKGDGKIRKETNASGYYELIHLKEAKWKLKVKAKGYHREKAELTISGTGTYRQDFKLSPKR